MAFSLKASMMAVVSSGESKTTTVVFDAPGEYLYICHLPGHEAYGMVGVLRVMPARS